MSVSRLGARVVFVVGMLVVLGLTVGLAAAAPSSSGAKAAKAHAAKFPLVIRSASVSKTSAGEISGSAKIANSSKKRVQGTTGALSWSPQSGGSLVQLKKFALAALKAGASKKVSFHVAVPAGETAGSYSVFVCVDVLSQLQAFSQAKNCSEAGTVTVAGSGSSSGGSQPNTTSATSPTTTTTPTTPTPTTPTPPDTAITSAPGSLVNTTTAVFDFTSNTAGSTFQCSLDGAPWASCTSPQTYTNLAAGAHTFEARADSDGTVDPTPAQATWTIDTTPPVVTLTTPANGSEADDSTPTFAGTAGTAAVDSSSVTVRVYTGSSASGTLAQTLTTTASAGAWSVPASNALADGTYTAQASQSDGAGNTGLRGPNRMKGYVVLC